MRIIYFFSTTVMLRYLGNSEKDTGNWCFKDGTITFEEIFDAYRKNCSNKLLSIVSDCSYSGQWVRECAKTLDSLGVPPCGHRAREHGAIVKVFATSQPDEEAGEPCYSVKAVTMEKDGVLRMRARQLSQQKSTFFDSTKLVCCRDPDTPCPQTAFQQLNWENAVDRSVVIQLVRRKEGVQDMWYYVLLHRAGDRTYSEEFESACRKNPGLQLDDWGFVLECGEGKNPTQDVTDKVRNYTCVTL